MKNELLLPLLISISIPVVIGGSIAAAVLINHSSDTSSVPEATSTSVSASTPLSGVDIQKIQTVALQYAEAEKNMQKLSFQHHPRVWDQYTGSAPAPDYANGLVRRICNECRFELDIFAPIHIDVSGAVNKDTSNVFVSVLPARGFSKIKDFMRFQVSQINCALQDNPNGATLNEDGKALISLPELYEKLFVLDGYVDEAHRNDYSFLIIEERTAPGSCNAKFHVVVLRGGSPLLSSDTIKLP